MKLDSFKMALQRPDQSSHNKQFIVARVRIQNVIIPFTYYLFCCLFYALFPVVWCEVKWTGF